MKNARKLARSRRHKDYFNECWDYVEFCGERLNLSVSCFLQYVYIDVKNLFVLCKEFILLQTLLHHLEIGTKYPLKCHIIFILIQVLNVVFLLLIGKTVQRSKIGTLI